MLVVDGEARLAELPVGFVGFHRRKWLNYQLNRAHALGYADIDELRDTASTIASPVQVPDAFRAFAIWQRIAAAGFDVVAFEGPGQGGARALGGLTFDHDWEKPVGAVLDHFGVERAGLVGISMGGYWSLRAAGREPRIDRVVSWPPVYDWLHRVPAPVRGATRAMLRRRRFMTWSVRVRTRLVPTLRQVVDQALYLVEGDEPMDAVDWFLGMNPEHLGSERVTQDVLILCGEHDRFQPPVLTRARVRALTAARSVTVRTFTKEEHADQHCQMGNLDLACSVVTEWLQDPGPRA